MWLAPLIFSQLLVPVNVSAQTKRVDPGRIENGIYQNPGLGFSYKIPFGWVDRTKATQGTDDASSSQVLLAAFERPPEATGDTINSGVVIAVESAASYPTVKTAREYFGPLTEAAIKDGFAVINEPYEVVAGGRHLAREDFSKKHGKLTMFQSSLVMLKGGSIVSFTFIGGDSDEIDQLTQHLDFRIVSRAKPSASTSQSR